MRLAEFDEVRELVRLDDRRKIDETCRLEDLRVGVRQDGVRNRFEVALPGTGTFPLTDWAARQLLQTRLGIPLEFLAERCPPDMAQGIVDHFLATEPPRALLVRLFETDRGRHVRAILPGSYARFDNVDVIELAGRIADEHGLMVERYRIDENLFHLRLVFGEEVDAGEAGLVDPHRFGIFFRNSEVGQGVPEAQFAIVRQVCGNGMLGFAREPLMRLHASSLHSVDRERLVERFRDGLEKALKDRGRVIETIRSARGKKVKIADLAEEFRRIHKQYGLSLRNLEIVREAYRRESRDAASKTSTVFEIAGALNRAAQHLPAEESARYEGTAWDYMRDHVAN